jgi:hypothetical protein
VNVRLPIRVDETSAATTGACIQKTATLEHRYALVVFPYSGSLWVRLSAQVYLTMDDFNKAGRMLAELCRRINKEE